MTTTVDYRRALTGFRIGALPRISHPPKTEHVMPQPTVHIVDDDDAVRQGLGALMVVEDLPVRLYASGAELLGALPAGSGCVVTDVHMPQMTGIELTRRLKAAGSDLPVIVVTGRTDRSLAFEAMAAGACALLDKPFTAAEFVAAVRAALPDNDG